MSYKNFGNKLLAIIAWKKRIADSLFCNIEPVFSTFVSCNLKLIFSTFDGVRSDILNMIYQKKKKKNMMNAWMAQEPWIRGLQLGWQLLMRQSRRVWSWDTLGDSRLGGTSSMAIQDKGAMRGFSEHLITNKSCGFQTVKPQELTNEPSCH